MDHIPERRFLLNVFDYLFTLNKVRIPSSLSKIMSSLDSKARCYVNQSFGSSLMDIIQNQKEVRTRVYRSDLEQYYRRKVLQKFTERDFLEFVCFNVQNCVTDSCVNPEIAVEKYRMMMDVIILLKEKGLFKPETWFKLQDAAGKVQVETFERIKSRLLYLHPIPDYNTASNIEQSLCNNMNISEDNATSVEEMEEKSELKRKCEVSSSKNKILKTDLKKEAEISQSIDDQVFSTEPSTSGFSSVVEANPQLDSQMSSLE